MKPTLFGQKHPKPAGAGSGGGKKQQKADAEIDKRTELPTKQVEKLIAKERRVDAASLRHPPTSPAVALTPEPDLVSVLQSIGADQQMVAGRPKGAARVPSHAPVVG